MMRSSLPGRASFLPILSVAIVALFTFEQLRLFISGLGFGLVASRGIPVGLVGLVGFSIVSLTLVSVVLVASPGRSLVTQLVLLVAALRTVSQLVDHPLILLIASAAGVVVAGLSFPAFSAVFGGRVVGVGLLLGAALDVAVMAARHTLDLSRSSSPVAILTVIGLSLGCGGALVGGAAGVPGDSRVGSRVPAAALFAIGPWMAVHLTVTGNIGFVGATTMLGFSMAAAVCGIGAAIALAWTAPGRSSPQPALAGAILVVVLVLLIGSDGSWAAFLVVVGSITAGGALTGAFERETTADPRRAAWGAGAG